MAIRNAGFIATPKVSTFYTTRIAYIYDIRKLQNINQDSLADVRSPKLSLSNSRTTHSRSR